MLQIKIGHNKRQHFAVVMKFLGAMTDMSRILYDLSITIGPWPESRRKAVLAINYHLDIRAMSPAAASKLRGQLQWMDMYMQGRPCRSALSVLIHKQYISQDNNISDALHSALLYLKFAAMHLPDKCFSVESSREPAVVVYTDASTEFGEFGLRIGGLLFTSEHAPALCLSHDIPADAQARLLHRENQVLPAELLAVTATVWSFQHTLRGRDTIFFIDNQAAWSSIIRSASRVEDCALISLVTNLLLMLFDVRPWFEYVNTKQNPADILSREGFSSPDVMHCVQEGVWEVSSTPIPWDLLCSQFSVIIEEFSALGLSLQAS
jgi:hypothetical protein